MKKLTFLSAEGQRDISVDPLTLQCLEGRFFMVKKTVRKSSDPVSYISTTHVAGIDTFAEDPAQTLKYKELQQTGVDPQATCDHHASIFDAPQPCHEKRAPNTGNTQTPPRCMSNTAKESTTLLGSNS